MIDLKKEFTVKELEAIKLNGRKYFSENWGKGGDNIKYHFKIQFEDFLKSIIVDFRTLVYGEKIKEIKYPKDWKEAFKERWFPKWLLKRYPVKYYRYNFKLIYPDLPIQPFRNFTRIIINKSDI